MPKKNYKGTNVLKELKTPKIKTTVRMPKTKKIKKTMKY